MEIAGSTGLLMLARPGVGSPPSCRGGTRSLRLRRWVARSCGAPQLPVAMALDSLSEAPMAGQAGPSSNCLLIDSEFSDFSKAPLASLEDEVSPSCTGFRERLWNGNRLNFGLAVRVSRSCIGSAKSL